MSDEFIDLTGFGEDKSARYLGVALASLQYCKYGRCDELIGKIRPRRGDRVQLVHNPRNPYDENVIEVRWKDTRLHLGHLPREFGKHVALVIDAGHHVRAYVIIGGDGSAWSAEVVLVSDHFVRTNNHWDAGCYEQRLRRRGDVDKHDRVRGEARVIPRPHPQHE